MSRQVYPRRCNKPLPWRPNGDPHEAQDRARGRRQTRAGGDRQARETSVRHVDEMAANATAGCFPRADVFGTNFTAFSMSRRTGRLHAAPAAAGWHRAGALGASSPRSPKATAGVASRRDAGQSADPRLARRIRSTLTRLDEPASAPAARAPTSATDGQPGAGSIRNSPRRQPGALYLILNHRELYGLPRKFNIAFDGGGRLAVRDTNVSASPRSGSGRQPVAEGVYFRMLLGGLTGHQTFAADAGVLLTPDRRPAAAAIVKVFIAHGDHRPPRRGSNTCRPPGIEAGVRGVGHCCLPGVTPSSRSLSRAGRSTVTAISALATKRSRGFAISGGAGRLVTVAQLRDLADIAELRLHAASDSVAEPAGLRHPVASGGELRGVEALVSDQGELIRRSGRLPAMSAAVRVGRHKRYRLALAELDARLALIPAQHPSDGAPIPARSTRSAYRLLAAGRYRRTIEGYQFHVGGGSGTSSGPPGNSSSVPAEYAAQSRRVPILVHALRRDFIPSRRHSDVELAAMTAPARRRDMAAPASRDRTVLTDPARLADGFIPALASDSAIAAPRRRRNPGKQTTLA